MSDEEEEEEVEDEEEEVEEEAEPPKKQEDEFNEFRGFNKYSSYANMHKTMSNQNSHNPLEYYYNRQLPIPYQPSQYWVDRVQFHQQEIDRAKQVLLNSSQPKSFNYSNPMQHNPNYSPLPQYPPQRYPQNQQNSSYSQNYHQQPFIPKQYPMYGEPPMMPPPVFPPQPQAYPMIPQQQYYYPPPQQFYPQYDQGIPPNYQQNSFREPKPVQQKTEKKPKKVQYDDNKSKQSPIGVSQFQQSPPQPFTQEQVRQELSEEELEYLEFLRYREYTQKQKQQIDDQEFREFQEFRKMKEQQLFKSTVNNEETKRSLTDLYKRNNRQVFSELEFKQQLSNKREYDNYQRSYYKPPEQETDQEIDRAINALMRSQTGTNKQLFK